MTIARPFLTCALSLLLALSVVEGPFALIWARPAAQAAPHSEFRVVFASHQHLASQLDEAGREGYSCLLVARNEVRRVHPASLFGSRASPAARRNPANTVSSPVPPIWRRRSRKPAATVFVSAESC